jgi:riboflavin kinase
MPRKISGKLFSGLAQGEQFTGLDWVQEQWRTKLGFIPHPGTFNLRVGPEHHDLVRELKRGEAPIEIVPPSPDFCPAKCYRVSIGGVRGAIVIPMVPDYPPDVIEVLAPVNLRQALSTKDGDEVSVTLEE